MPDLKQITLPSGTTYDLRDSRVDSIISQGTRWVGVTTTPISDGSSTSTIIINGEEHQAEIGDITGYQETGKQQEEFIWSGTIWQEFGSTGSLKELAFKEASDLSASTPVPSSFSAPVISVTTSGTTGIVKEPSFSVSGEVLTISLVDKTVKTGDASYSATAPTVAGTTNVTGTISAS
jgi:hypothetical protein